MTRHYARPLVRLAMVLALTAGVGACQTMSDLDPTGLLSDDSSSSPDTQFPSDSGQQTNSDTSTTTPDLANIPARPATPDAAAQANAAQSVTAAGDRAQYSADALRAGTEPAAPPPPTASDAAATRQALASAAPPPSQASLDAPPTADEAPSAGAAAPAASSAPVAAAAPPPMAAEPVSPAPATTATASAAPPVATAALPAPPGASATAAPPGAEPAVPAVPMTAGTRLAMLNPTDAQLGFKPSTAPPLNASISQWVAPPVLAHYRQTAALAGAAGTEAPAVSPGKGRGMGGPAMSGDVIANLDAVPGTPMGMMAGMNGGVPPTAVIYFAGDGTSLPASARAQMREAVAAFRATGGRGTIKVVGHASSRTGNMSVERHMEVIFQKSQARANAVAQALIRAGVPAAKVIVQAVGDSQPIYYESMPKGEAGNRRAEIYVQG